MCCLYQNRPAWPLALQMWLLKWQTHYSPSIKKIKNISCLPGKDNSTVFLLPQSYINSLCYNIIAGGLCQGKLVELGADRNPTPPGQEMFWQKQPEVILWNTGVYLNTYSFRETACLINCSLFQQSVCWQLPTFHPVADIWVQQSTFLVQLVRAKIDNNTLKYWVSVFSLWVLLVSLRSGQGVWMPLYQPLPTEATFRRFKGGEAAPIFCLFCSGFFLFICLGQGVGRGGKHSKTIVYMGEFRKLPYMLRKTQAHIQPEKTLSFHLTQIPGTDTLQQFVKSTQTLGKVFQSFHIRFKCPIFKNNNKTKKSQGIQRNRSMAHSK